MNSELKIADPFYVRCVGGLPNGRRSRGGLVFTDSADTAVHPSKISEVNLRAILDDESLIKSDRPAPQISDLIHQNDEMGLEIGRLDAEIASLRDRLGAEEIRSAGLEVQLKDAMAENARLRAEGAK